MAEQKYLMLVSLLILLITDHSKGAIDFCYHTDPCTESVPTLDVFGRSTNCPYYGRNGLCDSSLTEAWYRTDTPMVNTCPEQLNICGSEPTVSDGMVTSTACMKGFTGCCEEVYNIVLKNCSSFVAYCLQHTKGCAERYCFGDTGACPTTTTTTTTTTMTTTMTTMRSSPASVDDTGGLSTSAIFGIIFVAIFCVFVVPGVVLLLWHYRKAGKRLCPGSSEIPSNKVTSSQTFIMSSADVY
ncbi:uncharacterized protein LOC110465308 isoform X2 [Mizuhopecten yessoensis]|uniref:Uromodulin n=1 Tax=Mizuhopecten yessoensis TaxID=6573 RepID=A0A210PRY5_MIZYE|nr:uncharacterized protein LOC110465308 isoform X2 [Mizuhopecten yessoensis]OWF39214.1 hypothetical protein KP79_PYT20326 [Mizuhopecten yessoensis]